MFVNQGGGDIDFEVLCGVFEGMDGFQFDFVMMQMIMVQFQGVFGGDLWENVLCQVLYIVNCDGQGIIDGFCGLFVDFFVFVDLWLGEVMIILEFVEVFIVMMCGEWVEKMFLVWKEIVDLVFISIVDVLILVFDMQVFEDMWGVVQGVG